MWQLKDGKSRREPLHAALPLDIAINAAAFQARTPFFAWISAAGLLYAPSILADSHRSGELIIGADLIAVAQAGSGRKVRCAGR